MNTFLKGALFGEQLFVLFVEFLIRVIINIDFNSLS